MTDRQRFLLFLPDPVRRLPADLVVVILVTAMVNVAVFVPVVRETPLRVPLGLAFVLFVLGYVFVAALFPEAGSSRSGDTTETDDSDGFLVEPMRSRIDWVERLALSFGLSITLIPLIGLALHFTPWEFHLVSIMVALTGFTLVATGVAVIRRWELPPDDRFRVPYREWYRTGRSTVLEPHTRFDGLLNVLLAIAIVLAVGSLAFAVMFPPEGEQFSAIYLLTENDDGDYVAADYPSQLVENETEEVIVGIDNHEREATDYTVVVIEQETETAGNETVITDQRELDRFELELGYEESTYYSYDLAPTMTGEDVRIVWLLYPNGEVPDEPTTESTEYYVHLWIDIDEVDE